MKSLLFIFSFLYSTIIYSQKAPSFGKVDITDLQTKECSYDKTAEAECLFDYGEVNYFVNFNSFTNETIFWQRIKIYSEKGLDEANIKIPFNAKGNRVSIIKITGITYNLNEKGEIEKTELDKNSVYRQKRSETFDEMVFSLPKVKAGSVFEYRYTVIKQNVLELDGWVFQQQIPVRHTVFDVGIPRTLGFQYRFATRMPIEEKSEDGVQGVRRKVFTGRNLPGLKSEPYMSCLGDYYQRVEFQLSGVNGIVYESATWKGFANLLLQDEDFGLQIRKNILKNLDLSATLKTITNPYEKVRAIYKFVQANIKWNGDNSYGCKNGTKGALDKHEGNSADMNLLLVNLLRDAGIEAYPVLVSSRENGRISTSMPFRDQFENVCAYAVMSDGNLFMDASAKNTPFFISPWDIQFTNAFVVDDKKPQLLTIQDIAHKYKLTSIIQSEITSDGFVKGNAKSYASEYAKVGRLNTLEKGKDEFKKRYYTDLHSEFSFDSLQIKNEDKDSAALESSVEFKAELQKSGDYVFYNLNFLSGLDKNPFLAEERISTIEFGHNQYLLLTGSVNFPETLVPEELPKNIKMIIPDSSIILQRMCQVDGNTISYRVILQINRPLYFADEYADFRAFYTAMLEALNEQIVFKKKVRP